MLSKKNEEKKGMTAEEIRAMREQERIDSVYPEPKLVRNSARNILRWVAVLGLTAILLVVWELLFNGLLFGLIYLDRFLSSFVFLSDPVIVMIRSAVVLAAALFIGHILKININFECAPFAEWSKSFKICLIIALAADVIFLLGSWFAGGSIELSSAPGMYEIVYYIMKIFIVPLENIILFVAIPSQIIEYISTFIFESRKQAERPLIVSSTVILAAAQLGLTWSSLVSADAVIIAYALIQSAVCSVLYHRSRNVWVPTAVYSGVTVLYYLMSWLLSMV